MIPANVVKDPKNLTLSITAQFPATAERLWQVWSDPRQLERWWGPPTYPATFVDHSLTPGGRMTYYMTGPEGERHHGWWHVLAVEPPTRLEFEDGFADDQGAPNPDLPVMAVAVTLLERPGPLTDMTILSTFASAEAMEQVLAMGAEEGMLEALSQIEGILSTAPAR